MRPISRTTRLRRRVAHEVSKTAFSTLGRSARLDPALRRVAARLQIDADVPYCAGATPDQRLDIYRPTEPTPDGRPRPALIYVHGGGFSMLSKDTHWGLALRFANRGFVVFNINYRLAPRHRFPAAIEDACAAFDWVARNAHIYGADLSRLVLAGESAGGNLVTALSVATLWERPEPWARAVHDLGVVPRVVMPACGYLQVSDPDRFRRRRALPFWLYDLIERTSMNYLPPHASRPGESPMADPLLLVEGAEAPPERPLPDFFIPCGTRDPILDDSRRLGIALERLGAAADVAIYPGGVHAFHAMPWDRQHDACWADTWSFLGARGLLGRG